MRMQSYINNMKYVHNNKKIESMTDTVIRIYV